MRCGEAPSAKTCSTWAIDHAELIGLWIAKHQAIAWEDYCAISHLQTRADDIRADVSISSSVAAWENLARLRVFSRLAFKLDAIRRISHNRIHPPKCRQNLSTIAKNQPAIPYPLLPHASTIKQRYRP